MCAAAAQNFVLKCAESLGTSPLALVAMAATLSAMAWVAMTVRRDQAAQEALAEPLCVSSAGPSVAACNGGASAQKFVGGSGLASNAKRIARQGGPGLAGARDMVGSSGSRNDSRGPTAVRRGGHKVGQRLVAAAAEAVTGDGSAMKAFFDAASSDERRLYADLCRDGAPAAAVLKDLGMETIGRKGDEANPPEEEYSESDMAFLAKGMDFLQATLAVSGNDDETIDITDDLDFIAEGRRMLAISRFVVRDQCDTPAAATAEVLTEVAHTLAMGAEKGTLVLLPRAVFAGANDGEDLSSIVKEKIKPALSWLGLSETIEIKAYKVGKGGPNAPPCPIVRILNQVETTPIPPLAEELEGDEVNGNDGGADEEDKGEEDGDGPSYWEMEGLGDSVPKFARPGGKGIRRRSPHGRAVRCADNDDDGEQDRPLQVIVDVDDTIKSSGGVKVGKVHLGGVDTQYPRGAFYPGVFTFVRNLSAAGASAMGGDPRKRHAGSPARRERAKKDLGVGPPSNSSSKSETMSPDGGVEASSAAGAGTNTPPLPVAVLTARAREFKWALQLDDKDPVCRRFREAGDEKGWSGKWGIGSVYYGSVAEWIIGERKGWRKLENFRILMKDAPKGSDPRYVFVGDTGELDEEAGRRMISEYPERMKGLFLHTVAEGGTRPPPLPNDEVVDGIPIVYFRTYVGAAAKAVDYGLLDDAALAEVIVAARRDLEVADLKNDDPSRSAELEDDICIALKAHPRARRYL